MHKNRFKLSVMMFLEFFIWGAWLPLIFGYLPSLGFSSWEQSWILNAFALASFVGMFFSNQFADRNFAAERFLAVSHLIGGVSILGLAFTKEISVALGLPSQFWPFFILMLIHSLFYVPTISITNSIAFANLTDATHDFPRVRLWGTIGWIAASWPFVFLLIDWSQVNTKLTAMDHPGFMDWMGTALATPLEGPRQSQAIAWTYITAGIASLVLAAFSLLLPHTPPNKAKSSDDSFALLESLRLLAMPFMFVLFVVTFIDAAVHQCYFIWTDTYLTSVGVPKNWVMPIMSIGQIAEIGTMAFLGYCLKALGWRTTMVIGVLGHAVRFAVFALVPDRYAAGAIIVLHGVCYAFFFATVYIFVDEFFPKDARTSAQGLFNFLILGVGPFVANFVWPLIGEYTANVDAHANVKKSGTGLDLIVAGKVLNPAEAEREGITLTFLHDKEKVEERKAKLDANGRFSEAFADVPTENLEFTLPTQRNYVLFPPRPETFKLSIDKIKLPEGKDTAADAALKSADGLQIVRATQPNFQSLFLAPALTAVAAALALLLFFRPPEKAVPDKAGH